MRHQVTIDNDTYKSLETMRRFYNKRSKRRLGIPGMLKSAVAVAYLTYVEDEKKDAGTLTDSDAAAAIEEVLR